MKPASKAFDPERVAIIQKETACSRNQAVVALYSLEEYDWKRYKRRPGDPAKGAEAVRHTAKFQSVRNTVQSSLIQKGLNSGVAEEYTREIFLELARCYGGNSLYIAREKHMSVVCNTE